MRDTQIGTAKRELRARMLATRAALDAAHRATAATAIRETLLADPRVEMAGTVAAYWAFGTEPDTRGLVYALWKHGATVLLPVLRADHDLDWATYDGPETVQRGAPGSMEPAGERLGVDAVRAAALVIVPAVAVDSTGLRLGRGGGSYDRALARVAPSVLSVALLYDGELVDALPEAPHDQRVRAAVTPSAGLHRF